MQNVKISKSEGQAVTLSKREELTKKSKIEKIENRNNSKQWPEPKKIVLNPFSKEEQKEPVANQKDGKIPLISSWPEPNINIFEAQNNNEFSLTTFKTKPCEKGNSCN